MPLMNFRNANGFGPQDDGYQNAGGLPGLLRQVMQQQATQQQAAGLGSVPVSSPSQYPDDYGNPQGLFGRILALQRQEGLPSGPHRQGAPSINVPSMTTPVGYRIVPSPIPLPIPWPGQPLGPETVPHIPIPAIPEPWKTIGRFLQIYPRILSGLGGGGDDHRRCLNAADGSTDDWEELCRRLERAQNNTVGGESAGQACWSKTYESRTNKKLWCDNQFGGF